MQPPSFSSLGRNEAAVKHFKIILHEDKNATLPKEAVVVRMKLLAQLLEAAK